MLEQLHQLTQSMETDEVNMAGMHFMLLLLPSQKLDLIRLILAS
jgi:hypothetical protein